MPPRAAHSAGAPTCEAAVTAWVSRPTAARLRRPRSADVAAGRLTAREAVVHIDGSWATWGTECRLVQHLVHEAILSATLVRAQCCTRIADRRFSLGGQVGADQGPRRADRSSDFSVKPVTNPTGPH
jgi:hypothetical protein